MLKGANWDFHLREKRGMEKNRGKNPNGQACAFIPASKSRMFRNGWKKQKSGIPHRARTPLL